MNYESRKGTFLFSFLCPFHWKRQRLNTIDWPLKLLIFSISSNGCNLIILKNGKLTILFLLKNPKQIAKKHLVFGSSNGMDMNIIELEIFLLVQGWRFYTYMTRILLTAILQHSLRNCSIFSLPFIYFYIFPLFFYFYFPFLFGLILPFLFGLFSPFLFGLSLIFKLFLNSVSVPFQFFFNSIAVNHLGFLPSF